MRPHHTGEHPGANDVVGFGGEVHGKGLSEQIGVALPTGDDLGSQRGRGPGVHDVGVTNESSGDTALRFLVSGWWLGSRIYREGRFVRQ